jgi:hypothetical protein
MARTILSIIAGLLSGIVVIFVIEIIFHAIKPLPIDVHDTIRFKNYVHNEAPEAFHIIILSSYALGSFAGGFITAFISLNKKILRSMTVGGILMGIGLNSLVTLEHPSWVIVTAIFIFLPAAYLGGLIGRNFSAKKQLSH